MRIRFLLMTFGAAWQVLACSCVSSEPIKACQIYQQTPVVFRGRIIDDNHDRTAWSGQPTRYRFKVLEAFKGVPSGIEEVFIDPSNICGAEFVYEHDYLVYTSSAQQTPASITVFQGRQVNSPVKPIPAAWKGLERLPVYTVGGCGPTRALEDQDADLAYLRLSVTGSSQMNGWIEGRAVQNFSWPYRFADFVAAADAMLTVTSPSGDRSIVGVQADGTFRIGPVPPGLYAISVQSPVLGNGELQVPAPTVEVPSGGCAVANASFKTQSTISGKVLGGDGTPVSRVRLELGELKLGGKVRVVPDTASYTDRDGNFKISNAPTGRIVLAANLNGAPTTKMPFDPVYAPDTENVSAARVFVVQPGEQMKGVSLRLPGALSFGNLHVEVKWPDGSPALGGARAFAEWNGAEADFEQAPNATNRVRLRLALGRRYEIQVDWIDAESEGFLRVHGASPQTLYFTRDAQTVELRLKTPRPK